MNKILALQKLGEDVMFAQEAASQTSCASCQSEKCCSHYSIGCESTAPQANAV